MEKDRMTELLGFEPSPVLRRMIIEESVTTGEPLEKVADKYAMPPHFYMWDGTTTFEYDGERITPAEFKRRFPYRRLIIVTEQD
jgi:hypothetical protein